MRAAIIALLILIPISIYASARANSGGLAQRVAELEAQVAAMEEILQFVYIETEEMDGLTGPHWIIEGVNVHVRSGSGSTNDDCRSDNPNFPHCESITGLGNLVVGYNERMRRGPPVPSEIRTGSHNLVVGEFHTYTSFAGFIAGQKNDVNGPHASVLGGRDNKANARLSTVSGGNLNEANGAAASVSGGQNRFAPDDLNWAAGDLLEPN